MRILREDFLSTNRLVVLAVQFISIRLFRQSLQPPTCLPFNNTRAFPASARFSLTLFWYHNYGGWWSKVGYTIDVISYLMWTSRSTYTSYYFVFSFVKAIEIRVKLHLRHSIKSFSIFHLAVLLSRWRAILWLMDFNVFFWSEWEDGRIQAVMSVFENYLIDLNRFLINR